MVAEGVVLLWIKYFQKGGGRIPTEIGPKFIDFIEHEERVVGACFAEALDNSAWKGADIGAAVTTYFSLVSNATQ